MLYLLFTWDCIYICNAYSLPRESSLLSRIEFIIFQYRKRKETNRNTRKSQRFSSSFSIDMSFYIHLYIDSLKRYKDTSNPLSTDFYFFLDLFYHRLCSPLSIIIFLFSLSLSLSLFLDDKLLPPTKRYHTPT